MFGDPDVPQREGVRLRAAWAEALGTTTAALEGSGLTRVERDDLDAVVVVRLGAATVVAAPPSAKAALGAVSAEALLDADRIAAALPGARPIGSAHLLFTGARPPLPDREAVPATSFDVAAVGASMAEDEWDEAGVQTMERRWAVRDGDAAAAVAGYQPWHGAVAHLGVATAPGRRRGGFGTAAAARAVREAVDAGLVAQWRCRVGNEASLRLADRLGFTRLGMQASVALG
ncbi:GNAT family N-acetyltransferase [Agrococcus carbonis]|uniref:Protein N-acetyltransferase, RimJ/RimL family n=1 Tax=Agrococcus carbonis TaxID=684552 RepID=A0A1H1PNS1_9MICO|nr:GNAT family protein [Agrococcus carbonis]SDS12745.1 Protein N-acetyltransferase, RimJ/RimL family [Agrococcus carbonis]